MRFATALLLAAFFAVVSADVPPAEPSHASFLQEHKSATIALVVIGTFIGMCLLLYCSCGVSFEINRSRLLSLYPLGAVGMLIIIIVMMGPMYNDYVKLNKWWHDPHATTFNVTEIDDTCCDVEDLGCQPAPLEYIGHSCVDQLQLQTNDFCDDGYFCCNEYSETCYQSVDHQLAYVRCHACIVQLVDVGVTIRDNFWFIRQRIVCAGRGQCPPNHIGDKYNVYVNPANTNDYAFNPRYGTNAGRAFIAGIILIGIWILVGASFDCFSYYKKITTSSSSSSCANLNIIINEKTADDAALL